MYKSTLLILITLVTLLSAKELAFRADDHHISVGGAVGYHQPYVTASGSIGSGGFILVWDKALKQQAFFSMGADFQTLWYSDGYRISTAYRFGFHPFGLPILQGEVPIAKHLDPYIVMRGGLHFDTRRNTLVAPLFSPIVLGTRWYFNDNFALWGEFDSWYGLAIGIGFWL